MLYMYVWVIFSQQSAVVGCLVEVSSPCGVCYGADVVFCRQVCVSVCVCVCVLCGFGAMVQTCIVSGNNVVLNKTHWGTAAKHPEQYECRNTTSQSVLMER